VFDLFKKREKRLDDHHRSDPKPLAELLDETFSEALKDVSEIITSKIELAKLDVLETVATVASGLIIAVVAGVGGFYLLTSLALFLGEKFGRLSLGFLVVGVALTLAVTLIQLAKPDLLKNFFLKLILRELSKKESAQPDAQSQFHNEPKS
jgi:hypothetical protein